jgi:hypothetical protein
MMRRRHPEAAVNTLPYAPVLPSAHPGLRPFLVELAAITDPTGTRAEIAALAAGVSAAGLTPVRLAYAELARLSPPNPLAGAVLAICRG